MTMICDVWQVPRSSVYAARDGRSAGKPSAPSKRGPKTTLSDLALVEAIHDVLQTSDFFGEGHRKVTFRLRAKGIRVGKNRVLRLMREHGLSCRGGADTREEIAATAVASGPIRPTSCGAPMRRVSTPETTGGAGSSERSITA